MEILPGITLMQRVVLEWNKPSSLQVPPPLRFESRIRESENARS